MVTWGKVYKGVVLRENMDDRIKTVRIPRDAEGRITIPEPSEVVVEGKRLRRYEVFSGVEPAYFDAHSIDSGDRFSLHDGGLDLGIQLTDKAGDLEEAFMDRFKGQETEALWVNPFTEGDLTIIDVHMGNAKKGNLYASRNGDPKEGNEDYQILERFTGFLDSIGDEGYIFFTAKRGSEEADILTFSSISPDNMDLRGNIMRYREVAPFSYKGKMDEKSYANLRVGRDLTRISTKMVSRRDLDFGPTGSSDYTGGGTTTPGSGGGPTSPGPSNGGPAGR